MLRLVPLALAAALVTLPAAARGAPLPERAAQAADTIRGRITDSAGAPVAAARVELAELGFGTLTDSSGAFHFAGVPAGGYTLVVRRLGYAPVARPVRAGGEPVVVALRATPLPIEAVTVTATREPIDPLASPLATSALGREALRREHGVSLAHALEALPGVRTLRTGEQVGKPVIRGLSGARVLVLDNGSRLEDYSWSDEDGPSVDARLAERVEVIRGPASVLYGSDALGGVVNAVPRDLPDARGRSGFTRAGVELYGASNNTEFGTALHAEGARDALGWRLMAIGRHAGDLHTPDGELPNTGFGAVNGEAAVGVHGERGALALRYAHHGGEFKLLEAGGPPPGQEEEEGGPERKSGDDRVQLAATTPLGAVRLEAKAQWQRHSLTELADAFEAGQTGSGAMTETEIFNLLLNTVSADLLAHHQLGQRVRGTVGASLIHQTNKSHGPLFLVPDARLSSGALFAFEQGTWGRWSILAGARADARRLKTDPNAAIGAAGESRNITATSANLGAVFQAAHGVALSANVGRAFRDATLFERYANGPLLADQRYVVGDTALDPETSLGVDVGVRWERARIRGELTAFRNDVSHFIYLARSPGGEVQQGLPVYRYLAADARLVGGEASLAADPWRPITLRARADYVRATNDATDEPLPQTPPLRVDFGAELHAEHTSWAERAYVGVESELVAEQTRLSPLDSPAGASGHTLFHVAAGLERQWHGHDMRLDLRVRNLTDVAYRDFLSRYKDFALSPGRSVVVRLATGI